MERLKMLKEALMTQACAQLNNLECVDTKEMGEVIDMLKDLEEAIYYCTVVKAMNKTPEEETLYYREGSAAARYPEGGRAYYNERYAPINFRDEREGRSPLTRKMYMESKELHHDQARKMQELEDYMKELTDDIMEMIEDASPEEKETLQKKIHTLATKINV